jgi:hypothetical protein
MSLRCFFADGPPSGLAEAAEDWGAERFAEMWWRAHQARKRHDDGKGRCVVCGIALDFDAWMDERAELVPA